MRIVIAPTAILATALLFSSCGIVGGDRIKGNGNITTNERSTAGFHSIEAGGDVELHVRQESNTPVSIVTDANLQEFVETIVENDKLIIRTKRGVNLDPSKTIIAYASAPEFKSLDVSGASKIIGDSPLTGAELELNASGASEINLEVKTKKLNAEISGASSMQLRGSSNTASIEASGASHVRCLDFQTEETSLDLSGASNAEVAASKQLNIEASGASEVKYRGNANINQKSSGASSVQKIS